MPRCPAAPSICDKLRHRTTCATARLPICIRCTTSEPWSLRLHLSTDISDQPLLHTSSFITAPLPPKLATTNIATPIAKSSTSSASPPTSFASPRGKHKPSIQPARQGSRQPASAFVPYLGGHHLALQDASPIAPEFTPGRHGFRSTTASIHARHFPVAGIHAHRVLNVHTDTQAWRALAQTPYLHMPMRR